MDETYSDPTYSGGTDSWALARLGNVIDVYVDRNLNAPQVIQPTTGYGIGPDGQVYQVGQPTTVQTVSPVPRGGNINILFLLGLVLLVARHG
ncbi:MAG: hypothetical protein ACXU9C_01705 [Xanthobacteraceae bacterium]